MFTNTGKKLLFFSKVVLAIGIIVSLFVGIICIVLGANINNALRYASSGISGLTDYSYQLPAYGTVLIFVGIFTILFGSILSYVAALFVNGFGRVVENTDALAGREEEPAIEGNASMNQVWRQAQATASGVVQGVKQGVAQARAETREEQPQMPTQPQYQPQMPAQPQYQQDPVPPQTPVQPQYQPQPPVQPQAQYEAQPPVQPEIKAPETAPVMAQQAVSAPEEPLTVAEPFAGGGQAALETQPEMSAQPMPSVKFCGQCGTPNEPDYAFCIKCGSRLD